MLKKFTQFSNRASSELAASFKRRPKTWLTGGVSTIIATAIGIWFLFFLSYAVLETYRELSTRLDQQFPQVQQRQDAKFPPKVVFSEPPRPGSPEQPQLSQDAITDSATALVRRGSYIIQLVPDATTDQIKSLLSKYHLEINGGFREAGVLYLQRSKSAPKHPQDIAEKTVSLVIDDELVQNLRKEAIVKRAFTDIILEPQVLPRQSGTQGVDENGNLHSWVWDGKQVGRDGNWGLKAFRVPAAWTIVKHAQASERVQVAVIDQGFSPHEDLALTAASEDMDSSQSRHGNHVAGIIGATFGNGLGVDGVALNAELVVKSASFEAASTINIGILKHPMAMIDILDDINGVMGKFPKVRLVNVSMGINWRNRLQIGAITTEDSDRMKKLVLSLGAIVRDIMEVWETKYPDMIVVSAAGNDSLPGDDAEAKHSNPFNAAATITGDDGTLPDNIIVVEATSRAGKPWENSNVGGHISAPGVDILSSEGGTLNSYGTQSGTSMAAPYVTGTAALIKAYKPTLSTRDVFNIIIATAHSVSGSSTKRIDALDAVLEAGGEDALVKLADLNRDGQVDTHDLVNFIGQFKILNASRASFPEDLNGDGAVTSFEHRWPLIDLNGSGTASLDGDDRRFVRGNLASDLDVLRLAWTDSNKPFPTEDVLHSMLTSN